MTASSGERERQYRVQLCATCEHPGGQHIIDKGCRLCDCEAWEEGRQGWWSDADTAAWEAHSGSSKHSEVEA